MLMSGRPFTICVIRMMLVFKARYTMGSANIRYILEEVKCIEIDVNFYCLVIAIVQSFLEIKQCAVKINNRFAAYAAFEWKALKYDRKTAPLYFQVGKRRQKQTYARTDT